MHHKRTKRFRMQQFYSSTTAEFLDDAHAAMRTLQSCQPRPKSKQGAVDPRLVFLSRSLSPNERPKRGRWLGKLFMYSRGN